MFCVLWTFVKGINTEHKNLTLQMSLLLHSFLQDQNITLQGFITKQSWTQRRTVSQYNNIINNLFLDQQNVSIRKSTLCISTHNIQTYWICGHNERHNFGLFLLGTFVCKWLFSAWGIVTATQFTQHWMRQENVYELWPGAVMGTMVNFKVLSTTW